MTLYSRYWRGIYVLNARFNRLDGVFKCFPRRQRGALTDKSNSRQAGLTLTAGLLRGLVALAVRLSVGILLCVLQAELMAHLERLAYGPHDAHGVRLTGSASKERTGVWGKKMGNREFELKLSVYREEVQHNPEQHSLTDHFLLARL